MACDVSHVAMFFNDGIPISDSTIRRCRPGFCSGHKAELQLDWQTSLPTLPWATILKHWRSFQFSVPGVPVVCTFLGRLAIGKTISVMHAHCTVYTIISTVSNYLHGLGQWPLAMPLAGLRRKENLKCDHEKRECLFSSPEIITQNQIVFYIFKVLFLKSEVWGWYLFSAY